MKPHTRDQTTDCYCTAFLQIRTPQKGDSISMYYYKVQENVFPSKVLHLVKHKDCKVLTVQIYVYNYLYSTFTL